MKHYLSFGGGVNSVALYLLMEQLDMDFEAVFVNHGGDLPETYEYVDYFIATGRPINVLKPRHGDLYDYAWEKEMVPTTFARWCTRMFKVEVVNQYVSKPCWMHLGIDAGETKRAHLNATKGIESRWLLIEHNIDRDGCKELIVSAGLEIPQKSGCYFCPYQRIAQWKQLRKKHPDLFCKAQQLEKRNIEYRLRNNKPARSIRNDGRTLDKIINEKQKVLPGMEDLEYPPCNCGL